MTSDIRVGIRIQKSPPNIGRYWVKIVGHGRYVDQKWPKKTDVIYGRSLSYNDKSYDPLQEIGLFFDIRILQSLSFPDQNSVN